VPKALATDAQALQLKMDGASQTFGIQAQDNIWVISCTYQQSAHNFVLQIPAEIVFSPEETPWLMIVIAIAVIVAVIAILIVVRRKRRTAATVAEILKDERPVF
jgi:cytochrome bd-type quinol oxidase subunit 2